MSRPFIGAAIALTAIAAVAIGVGLVWDADSFAGNLLAEVAGIAASVIIALTLVERLLERRRTEQWERVREQTLRSIHAHVGDMAMDALMASTVSYHMPSGRDIELLQLVGEDPSKPGTAEALAAIAQYIRENAESLGRVEGLHDSSTRTLYDVVKPEITQMRDVLTPRVLQFGQDADLVELLVRIEDSERRWVGALGTIEDDWGMPEEYAWRDAGKTFQAAADVARHIHLTLPRGGEAEQGV